MGCQKLEFWQIELYYNTYKLKDFLKTFTVCHDSWFQKDPDAPKTADTSETMLSETMLDILDSPQIHHYVHKDSCF